MIHPVIRMGTERLIQPSLPVEKFATPELYALIHDMHETMLEKKGVGIAAPQIGVYLRVIMFGFEKNERYPNELPVPFTVLINPSYEPLSDEKVDLWEGCLSIPGLRGLVPRYKKIQYTGYDPEGHLITREVENFHARVLQHECDHIDGILYPHRLPNLTQFGFDEEIWERAYGMKKPAL